ncbi:uncharacterized protein FIBRA_03570 [Fibroporia radiculosa]|uniref:Protein kinase domain-containing protein n=1 Tax=Fibroporia radiculosa TaxID=599839 RepID=J4H2H1_9APHY|nr:uncharacterized protein FIBRA_03570 [Fibroporia radiculosa]CCM01514.1 predicted protein [Fibroporia radiculosa]
MTGQDPRLPSYVYITPEQAKRFAEHTARGIFALGHGEQFWRERQLYLKDRGYMLRPRYMPDWSPSWIGTLMDPIFCEDSIMLIHCNVIDATRSKDGSIISIKTATKNSEEIAIASFLSSEELKRDPANHCVSLLEVFDDPLDPTLSFLVMPYLRPFDDPDFGAIGEAVDFVGQTLEGLLFLHRHRVAHRDCAAANIMMDGRPLYPHGHHPVRRSHAMDTVHELSPLARIDHPVRYYFIDFGISTRFEEGESPYVLGRKGRDKELPELSSDVPYDAFKVDLFILGNLYKKEFVDVRSTCISKRDIY